MSEFAHFLENGVESDSGPLESVAAVWFYKKVDGEFFLLFQKRSKFVSHNAGFYDVSAGGHLDRGETPLEACLRETKEELGVSLSPEDLVFLFSERTRPKLMTIYLSDRTEKDDVFTLDPREVESIEWVSLSDLDDFVEKNAKPPLKKNWAEFKLIKEYLKSF